MKLCELCRPLTCALGMARGVLVEWERADMAIAPQDTSSTTNRLRFRDEGEVRYPCAIRSQAFRFPTP